MTARPNPLIDGDTLNWMQGHQDADGMTTLTQKANYKIGLPLISISAVTV